MPRNGSGSMSTPNTFVPGTTITASDHNENWTDNAAEITNSLALDGQSTMTGQIKAANGTVALPGITFGSDPDTGISRTDANTMAFSADGALVMQVDPTGAEVTGDMSVSGALDVGGAGWLQTASIADKAVTYVKVQKPSAASKILGSSAVAGKTITGAANNGSGLIRLTVGDTSDLTTGQKKSVTDVLGTTEANGTWTITVISSTTVDLQGSAFANTYVSGGTLGGSVEEISIGSGLLLSNANVLTAAFPPPAAFKNLSIKVATTTTVTLAADFVAMTDGSSYLTAAVSGTINLGTTGANALDAGTVAIDTWYAIFSIAKPDGTTAGLASTSATAPTMPSGYTYKARVGWVRTIHASATLLGTWQMGRTAQYVVGLAQTTAPLLIMDSGAKGTFSGTSPTGAAVSTSSYVPSTASRVHVTVNNQWSNNGAGVSSILVAPNASWFSTNTGPQGSGQFVWRLYLNAASASSGNEWMLLESTNLYWASSTNGAAISCSGWEDNI